MIETELASYIHNLWIQWMTYLLKKAFTPSTGDIVIPQVWADRWQKLMRTKYEDLTPEERESDLEIARTILAMIRR